MFFPKKRSNAFMLVAIALFVAGVILYLYPNIFEAILERFGESDMSDGNGRLRLINYWIERWGKNVFSVLFGVGLFACNVHCMQLQYLFGTGLLGSSLILMFAISTIRRTRKKYSKATFEAYLPMLFIFIMAATVPVAGSLTFMFPTILAVFAVRLYDKYYL